MAWFAAVVVLKELFLAFYAKYIDAGRDDCIEILSHGLAMDISVASYLTVVPALLAVASVWTSRRWVGVAANIYCTVASIVMSAITVVDIGLFEAWGFRLDMTPLFYLTTSPAAAFASVEPWQAVAGIVGFGALGWGVKKITYNMAWKRTDFAPVKPVRSAVWTTVAGTVLTGLLVIPIRGGITVSTMNPGFVYFSDNSLYNQAALNPAFNLLYSATHQADFGRQFRFMDNAEARAIVEKGIEGYCADSVAVSSSVTHPDIWLIIMESFSSSLMPSLGGEAVAVKLDSIGRSGLSFTETYASSFRTDRGLPAILSAFPAQPTTSVMKFVDKAGRLPSLARQLAGASYRTSYYYGGDVNFTNMNAYLVNGAYENIVSDKDFAISERLSKWGVHDHVLMQRALADASSSKSAEPQFRVVQTSSSHEPFQVPYSNWKFAGLPRRNAFAYADSCVGAFVDSLRQLPSWNRTLVVITADHMGAWPVNPDTRDRHHIPFIITGGALKGVPAASAKPASQTDIAATVLDLAGVSKGDFGFGTSLLGKGGRGYAFFSQAHLAGVVTEQGIYDIDTDTHKSVDPYIPPHIVALIKAYLQELYSRLDSL